MTDKQEGYIHERKREACQILSGNTSLVHAPTPRDFELYAENDRKSVHFRKIVLNNTMEGGQCEARRRARRQMCGASRGMKDECMRCVRIWKQGLLGGYLRAVDCGC